MKYFKNANGEVFAYETQEERNEFGAPDLVAMTPEEIEAHLNPPVAPPTREQVKALRLAAYADPVTGSDRYFAEAARMKAMGEAGADAVIAAGVARHEEIKAAYPWPDEV